MGLGCDRGGRWICSDAVRMLQTAKCTYEPVKRWVDLWTDGSETRVLLLDLLILDV